MRRGLFFTIILTIIFFSLGCAVSGGVTPEDTINALEQRVILMSVFIIVLLVISAAAVFLFARTLILGKKLKEIADHDSLTEIYNRRRFMELGAVEFERSSRTGKESFIIIFDLDRFKDVNDTYGHLAGDKVLKAIVQRVKKTIRPYDLFGRYGGEEFIILMPEVNKENAIKASDRIRKTICDTPVEYEDKKIAVSASFGIAYLTPYNDMDAAAKYADEALYKAKEGRNTVVFCEGK